MLTDEGGKRSKLQSNEMKFFENNIEEEGIDMIQIEKSVLMTHSRITRREP